MLRVIAFILLARSHCFEDNNLWVAKFTLWVKNLLGGSAQAIALLKVLFSKLKVHPLFLDLAFHPSHTYPIHLIEHLREVLLFPIVFWNSTFVIP